MSSHAQFEEHQWNERVVLLFADDLQNRQMEEQLNALLEHKEGLSERDLVVYTVLADELKARHGTAKTKAEPAKIRQSLEVRPDEFRFILIGKDGTVKLSEVEIVSSEKLFKTIDAMPMRQREMGKD